MASCHTGGRFCTRQNHKGAELHTAEDKTSFCFSLFADSLSPPVNVTINAVKANSAVVTWDIPEGDPVIGFAITQQVSSTHTGRYNSHWIYVNVPTGRIQLREQTHANTNTNWIKLCFITGWLLRVNTYYYHRMLHPALLLDNSRLWQRCETLGKVMPSCSHKHTNSHTQKTLITSLFKLPSCDFTNTHTYALWGVTWLRRTAAGSVWVTVSQWCQGVCVCVQRKYKCRAVMFWRYK